MFDLEEELKKLPQDPGVYIMHDKEDVVIYVGKAKVLKNRVRQYFQKNSNHTPKTRAMISKIERFEYIVTDSEVEALVLECNLIKKYKPKYNILLKDDKHYPYIKVTINEPYPKIMMTRTLKKDGAKYFGPYMGMNTINGMLDVVGQIFHPPTCKRKFPDDIGKGRPCLNYHIKHCFAPCMGTVTQEEYRQVYFDICHFLDGNHKELIAYLTHEMKTASQEMEYEKAARIRDQIISIERVEEKQKIINTDKQTDADMIAYAVDGKYAYFEVFFVRNGKILGRENYRLENADEMNSEELMTNFVKQFYGDVVYIPQEILTETEIEDSDAIVKWLSKLAGKKVSIHSPKIGEKKRLVEMVKKNADIACQNDKIRRMKEYEKTHLLEGLQKTLALSKKPARIECYDISNISGADNVASMVVFENGRPANKQYRKFKIKSFEGADDYQAMQEVVYRRLRNALEEQQKIDDYQMKKEDAKFLPLPDLIFTDGGIGHVNAVKEILEQTENENIPVFGLVKDAKHRTRGIVSSEGEIELSMTGSVFHFVTRIQDEVHRVAIAYHRKLHGKNSVQSELDNIDGVGEKRRNALLKSFTSMDGIKNASVKTLSEVEGMNMGAAKAVYKYFHVDEGDDNV